MLYVKYPLSLRKVEDLLLEREIDICRNPAVMAALPSGFGIRMLRS